MKFKLFLAALALLATTAFAQVTQTIIAPNSALPGSCTTAQLPTWLDSAGTFYTCKGGTPTAVGGSGTFNALSGDATSTATGGATTVIQVEGGAIPVSGAVIGTNSSKQLVAATAHGIETPLVCADTSASGTVQVCTTSPTFTPASGDCVIYTTTTSNTGAGLTLNVNSLGAKSVAKWLGTTTLAAGDVPVTEPQLACYNGTVWNLSTIGNAPSGGGSGISGATAGNTVVATASTTGTSSPNVVFADQQTGADFCAKLSAAITQAHTQWGSYKGTIDARGFTTGQACASNPLSALPSTGEAGLTILMPAVSVTTTVGWAASANDVFIIGPGTGGSGGLFAGASFPATTPMITFGTSSSISSGNRIENMRIDANTNTTYTVVLFQATQEFSGLIHVVVKGGDSASTTGDLVSCVNCDNMLFMDDELLAAGDNNGLSFTYNAGFTGSTNAQETNLIARLTFNNTGLHSGVSAINFGSSTGMAWSTVNTVHSEGFAHILGIASANSIGVDGADSTGTIPTTLITIASGAQASLRDIRDARATGTCTNVVTDANNSVTIACSAYSFGSQTSMPGYVSGTANINALNLVGITGSTQCLQVSSTGAVSGTGSTCGTGGGGVTSVGWTGGIVSVATATTTPAFTIAGTSGGIPYFSGASTWASSGALPSGDFVLGGGAGSAPTATFSIVTAAKGGTGVANTATLTLGSSNQNWATLGTGIVKNTTTTGALTDAASADVIGLWTGSCTSSTFLRGDGACASASGSTGISGGTANFIPVFGTSTTITGNSHIDDGATTAGVLTATEPLVIVDSTDPNFIGFAANGVAPAVQTSQAGWGLGATLTTAGYYKMPDAPGSGFWTAANASGIVTNTFTAAPTGTVVGTSDSQTLTNKSIAGSEINSGLVASTVGGTGVNNTATLTLGSSNQNWATLGTGIVKNTTTTGALTDAASADVIGLWTGSCTSSTFLRGDGSCQTPAGGGSITFPQTVGGTTNSGGIPFFSNATTLTTSAALAANNVLVGGGAGVAPFSDALMTFTSTTGVEINSGTAFTPAATLEISGTENFNGFAMGATLAVTNGSCASGATSCTITNASSVLNPNGGYAVMDYGTGGPREAVCYTSATTTTITFGQINTTYCTATGRGIWTTSAQTHGSGGAIAGIVQAWPLSATGTPFMFETQDGHTMWNGSPGDIPSNGGQFFTVDNSAMFQGPVYIGVGNSQPYFNKVNTSGIAAFAGNSNPTEVLNSTTPSRPVASQSITGTSLTAITTTVTAAYPANSAAASSSAHGQLQSDCEIMWEQSTAVATVQFGVKLSAAPTDLYVIDEDFNGTTVTSSGITTITGTTATATSPTLTPANFGTGPYWTKLTLIMNPGTTNSPTVQLYGLTSNASDALLIEPGTGCSAWH